MFVGGGRDRDGCRVVGWLSGEPRTRREPRLIVCPLAATTWPSQIEGLQFAVPPAVRSGSRLPWIVPERPSCGCCTSLRPMHDLSRFLGKRASARTGNLHRATFRLKPAKSTMGKEMHRQLGPSGGTRRASTESAPVRWPW